MVKSLVQHGHNLEQANGQSRLLKGWVTLGKGFSLPV